MSLLSRDELRVLLCRDQLQLVRIASRFTIKGWLHSVSDKQNIEFESDLESPWKTAVDKLETVISGMETKPQLVRVVLSNHFLRYAIVDIDQALQGEAEQVAFVKHRFGQLFGETAQSWELRMDQEYPGSPYLASAVDEQLLFSLRELFKRSKVKLQSIQPCLMKAYNLCQSEFKDKNAWFVLFEHGNLCLVWLKDGHPTSVRTIKVGEDWLEKLTEIVDREIFLSELDTSAKEIFLWSIEHEKKDLPKNELWKINRVRFAIPAGLAGQYDEKYALAMCG